MTNSHASPVVDASLAVDWRVCACAHAHKALCNSMAHIELIIGKTYMKRLHASILPSMGRPRLAHYPVCFVSFREVPYSCRALFLQEYGTSLKETKVP